MPNYLLNVGEFTARSSFNEQFAEELEVKRPGWLLTLSTALSAGIDARLVTRADLQSNGGSFLPPFPETVKLWVADLLTIRAWDALG